jgi:hypothetical protein
MNINSEVTYWCLRLEVFIVVNTVYCHLSYEAM